MSAKFAANLTNMAACLRAMGRYKDALARMEEGMEIEKTVLGVDHISYALSLGGIANCYMDLSKPAEALSYY